MMDKKEKYAMSDFMDSVFKIQAAARHLEEIKSWPWYGRLIHGVLPCEDCRFAKKEGLLK